MATGLQQAIFEWSATLPAWQRDLARRLSISDRLFEDDFDEVIALLLGDERSSGCRPLELEDLPSDDDAQTPVELVAMGDMNNINSLAPGQRLKFASGLTVVYGDTGAGKSGHTRLLRRSCRSVERGEVLRDVFDPGASQGRQTATVVVRVSGEERELQLDLAERPPRVLSSVSVFDAACARIYVEQANVIDLIPRPLVLFDRLVRAQTAIAERLRAELQSLAGAPPEVAAFTPTTDVGQLFSGEIFRPGLEDRARVLAKVTDAEYAELQALAETEAEIRSDRSADLEASARRIVSAARSVREAFDEASRATSDDVLDQARMLRRRRDETIVAQKRLAADALVDAPVPGTGSEPWKALWEAARNFATSAGHAFPDAGQDARCELCQQTLDRDARQRMVAFEKYVGDDLEASLGALRGRATTLVRTAPDPQALSDQVHAWLTAIEDEALNAAVVAALAVYAARRSSLVSILSGDTPEIPPVVAALEALDRTIERHTKAAAGHAALRDDGKRRAVLSRLAELRDRARLAECLDVALRHVAARRRSQRIRVAIKELDTQKISLAQRKLGSQVVTDELRVAVSEELKALTPVPPRVTVSGISRKGQTVIRLELDAERCSHGVAQVLSDGEQRALSAAFFLAELRVGANRSAIVLDDPVTSLDQTRREYVARRLVLEARNRQVVVFTHDLAFLLMLQEQARLADVACHGQTLLRAGARIGLARNELPFEGLTPQKRLKELRGDLAGLTRLHREGHMGYPGEAERWCVQLRQTWEQTIEEIVLRGVVRRFIPSIEPKRLRDIELNQDIKDRVAQAMDRTSPWAHFRAPSLGLPARSPDQLMEMAAELAELHARLDLNKRQALRAVPPADTRTGSA